MTDRQLELVEPTFVLRASDPSAASLVRQWASRAERRWATGRLPPDLVHEIARARRLADDMDAWSKDNTRHALARALDQFSQRFPGGRSAEVIKMPRPTR